MTTATMDPATKPIAPERSLTQRLDALDKANVVRTYRKELKRDLKAGRKTVQALLLEPPELVETMKVYELLMHVPKYGRVKVTAALKRCAVSPSKTIGGLSPRQRDELVKLLRR